MFTYGHWNCEFEFSSEDYFGFIYLITNKITNQKYIGKRNFIINSGPRNGWMKYKSSSKYLLPDIKIYGKENFNFTILQLCTTKDKLAKIEIEIQINNKVLTAKLPCGLKEFYNRNIHTVGFDGSGTTRSPKTKKIQKEKALGNNIYYNPLTGETLRSKESEIPEGFVRGMSNITKNNMSKGKAGGKIYHIPGVDGSFWVYPDDTILPEYVHGQCPNTKHNQKGINGPRAILDIYKFENRYTGEIFEGIRTLFDKHANLTCGTVGKIINKHKFSTKCGWRLYGEENINRNPVTGNIQKHIWFNDTNISILLYPDDPRTKNLSLGRVPKVPAIK